MNKLTLIDKAFWLKKLPLFAALELDLLLPIADKLGVLQLHQGDVIFDDNEDAHRLYFIVEGEVEVREKGQPAATLTSGEFFGDEALFGDAPHAYEAVCKKATLLLTLSRMHLLTIIHECPSVAVALLQVYASAMPLRPRVLTRNTNDGFN